MSKYLQLKIGIIIPDRKDRPKFMQNCLRMIKAQTLQPEIIHIANEKPVSAEKDITKRYRTGYDALRARGLDAIALMENDDFYHPTYLQYMAEQWQKHGKPDLLGTAYTIYYHLKLKAWFTMNHSLRSSAMNTFIKPDLNFDWCVDSDPYTDLHLWMRSGLKGVVIKPPILSIGIKHGEGLCGGRNHTDKLERYINKDTDLSFLEKHMDYESFQFYTNYN